jgi:uncharacterized membrane protein
MTELDVWRTNEIVSAEQSGQIVDLYETAEEVSQHKRNLAIFALSSLAVVMIGLACLLAVGHNWQDMTANVKLIIIFGSLIGAHALGLWLRYARQRIWISEVVCLLGCILYGVAIWQIAQIFNIQSHYPDGIWFWAIGTLPFALCFDTILLHILYAVLLAVWVGSEILGFPAFHHLFLFGHSVAAPNGAYSLPLLALPGVIWAYRKQSAMTIAIYSPLLAWWAILQPLAWHYEVTNIVFFIGLAGAIFLLIAESHSVGSKMAKPFRLWGILLTCSLLIPLSYCEFIETLLFPWHPIQYGGYSLDVALAIIGIASIAIAMAVRCAQQRRTTGESCSTLQKNIFAQQWLPILLILLFVGLSFWITTYQLPHEAQDSYQVIHSQWSLAKWTPKVYLPVIIDNAVMLIMALWLMRAGLRNDRSLLFSAGVLYFLLWTVLRYLDLFAGVGGMLGAALMFLLCGLGLFAVARFWRRRKEHNHV